MNDLLAIPESIAREKLDPAIWVDPVDSSPMSEDDRQIRVISHFKRDLSHISVHAVPNGGRQSDWAKIRGWRMGVIAGEPDLGFDWIGGAARVEMKDANGKPSPEQVARLNQLHRMGKHVAICRTLSGVLRFMRAIGAPVLDNLEHGI